MKGSKINEGLVTDEFLASAANVWRKGAQQFFTPAPLAQFIARCLAGENHAEYKGPVYDPTGSGDGALLRFFPHGYGNEIDRDYERAPHTKIMGDCQKIVPLAKAIDMQCSMIVANPPFGLTWEYEERRGRSAQVAWWMIQDLLSNDGIGAMIVPMDDYLQIREACEQRIVASVRVPQMFGPNVRADCVVFFFTGSDIGYGHRAETIEAAWDDLSSLCQTISDKFTRWYCWSYRPARAEKADEDFPEKFDMLRKEFRNRESAQRRSVVAIRNNKIKVHFSAYDQVRLVIEGHESVLKRVSLLDGQSVFQFARDEAEWQDVMALAREVDLYIAPETFAAYEKAKAKGDFLFAPLIVRSEDMLGLAELRNSREIRCIKDCPEHGFRAGEVYALESETFRRVEEAENVAVSADGKQINTTNVEREYTGLRIRIGESL